MENITDKVWELLTLYRFQNNCGFYRSGRWPLGCEVSEKYCAEIDGEERG